MSTRTNSLPWITTPASPFQRGLVRPLLVVTQIIYVVFLSAGHFKENFSDFPVDVTIGSGVLALVLSLMCFLVQGGRIPYSALWMVVFFAAMSICALWTEWTPYAVEKATRFFTLTLLGALIPCVILTDLNGVKRFITLIIILGMVLASGVVVQLAGGGFTGDIGERTTGFATMTVALGSDAGQALVGLYACMLRGGRWLWLSLLCAPLFLSIVASGSRGPLFVAVAVLVFLTLRFSKPSHLNVWIMIVLITGAGIGLSGFSSLLPQGSVRRIVSVLEGQQDKSGEARKEANLVAVDEIGRNPFGMGFGGFGRVYNFGGKTDRIYPHNVFIEIAVENGILVALFFVIMALVSMRRSYLAALRKPALQPFFAILVFSVGESLISGEININRLFYALIVIGLQLPNLTADAVAV